MDALCPKGQRAFCLLCWRGGNPVTREQKGTLYVFLAAVLYSIGGLCIKVIPWNGMSINSGRNIIAMAVIGLYLWRVRHPLKWNRWIALGALAVYGTNALFSVANKLTTAANVIVLQFTAPIFVILFSILFFRKKPTRLDLIACGVVFGGVIFFFVDSLGAGNTLGNGLALLAGVCYSGVFLLNDLPDSDAISSVFWGDLISALTGLPFLVRESTFTPTAIISLVVLGAFQVGLAYILMTEGLKTTPAVTASLVSGIEPVLNPLLVAVFYHECIGPTALVGAIIVVAGVLGYNILRARQVQPKTI